MKENGFHEESMEKVRKDYQFKANHIEEYLRDNCEIDYNNKDYFTPTDVFYNHYRHWCTEIKRLEKPPLDENVLGSKLVGFGILHGRKLLDGKRPYVYKGVVLKHILEQQKQAKEQGQKKWDYYPSETTTQTATTITATTTDKQPTKTFTCPYCLFCDGVQDSSLFVTRDLKKAQLHIIFEHPEQDFRRLFDNSDDEEF
jgi:hypothetical protein